MPLSNRGDSVALEFNNVLLASGFAGATQATSCDNVYKGTAQSYFADNDNHRLCVRLVANTLVDATATLGYSSYITLYASSAQATAGQPAPPYSGTRSLFILCIMIY